MGSPIDIVTWRLGTVWHEAVRRPLVADLRRIHRPAPPGILVCMAYIELDGDWLPLCEVEIEEHACHARISRLGLTGEERDAMRWRGEGATDPTYDDATEQVLRRLRAYFRGQGKVLHDTVPRGTDTT